MEFIWSCIHFSFFLYFICFLFVVRCILRAIYRTLMYFKPSPVIVKILLRTICNAPFTLCTMICFTYPHMLFRYLSRVFHNIWQATFWFCLQMSWLHRWWTMRTAGTVTRPLCRLLTTWRLVVWWQTGQIICLLLTGTLPLWRLTESLLDLVST